MIARAAAMLVFGMAAQASANECTARLQELGLLASLDAGHELIQQYRALPPPCLKQGQDIAGQAGLPAAGNSESIKQWALALHQQRIKGQAQQAKSALTQAQITEVNLDALKGLGPENTVQALSSMALEVASAGLSSRQKHSEARTLKEASRKLKGKEPGWRDYGTGNTSQPGNTQSGHVDDGSMHRPIPPLPVPESAIKQAQCKESLAFLEPQLRNYSSYQLQELRSQILMITIPQILEQSKKKYSDKQTAIKNFHEEAKTNLYNAGQAAFGAQASDGYGDVGVPKALNDQHPLDYPCDIDSAAHVTNVCGLILNRWASLFSATTAAILEKCW